MALQQAQLYVWIETLFQKRPETGRARFLDSTDQTVHFQEALLRNLIGQGTSESVAAVSWIADQLPHVEWLRWSLADARENQRRVEWVPLSPRNAIQKILERIIETPVISDKEKIVEDALEGIASREADVKIDFAKAIPEMVTVPAKEPEAPSVKHEMLRYLIVNDEWNSRRGGISTFNRQVCIALAKYGHKVFCFIPIASQEDIDLAAKDGVEIVTAKQHPGLTNEALLARGPRDRTHIKPDAVIGHDHITGAQALALARDEFDCPYLHFIHTSPEEIEPFKDTNEKRVNGIVDYSKSSDKGKTQANLCAESDIVLAVGPKLERFIRTNLAGKKDEERIISILPGLNPELLLYRRQPGYKRDLYCLMTGRLNETFIKGTDLFVRIAGDFQGHKVSHELRTAKFIMRGFDKATMNEDVAALKRMNNVTTVNILAREFTNDEAVLMQDLKSASSFLMPSKTEGFGLTGLEAIAAGVPTIVSAESGLGETLLTVSQGLPSNLKRIASDCVLDTQPDGEEVLGYWVGQVSKHLSDPDKAFAEAHDLRTELKATFSWPAAAETITEATLLALGR
jgi:glycosyltransferase involved in cell wall biosynthesis